MKDLQSPTFYWPLFLGLSLMFFQEFSGINCILFYSPYIFQLAGIGVQVPYDIGDSLDKITADVRQNAHTSALYVTCTLFSFTIVSCFLADYVGRRKLLLSGSIVMSLALLFDGIYCSTNPFSNQSVETYLHTISKSTVYSKFALVSMLLFIAAFSIGWGPLPWLMMSELFPIKTRGVATSIVTCVNWLFVFITTSSFCLFFQEIRPDGAFWFFTAVTVLGFFFVLFFVPETRRKPLEEVAELFIRRQIVQVNIPWIRHHEL